MAMEEGAPEMHRWRDGVLRLERWAQSEAARRGEETGVHQEGRRGNHAEAGTAADR
jgi:hypothetical protein